MEVQLAPFVKPLVALSDGRNQIKPLRGFGLPLFV